VPRYRNLRLLLFGRGPLEQDLRAQSEKLGLTHCVHFAGFRDDLDRYLACAELLVHPALQEGLGVAALQAQAAGVPVVGFDAGGLREAVADGETGLLVAPGDPAALANGIAVLLDDAVRRRQLALNGRRRMQAEFSIDGMVAAHLRIYKKLLDDGYEND
jgi:glycosyltransferase involved in cell wall biosynthesis